MKIFTGIVITVWWACVAAAWYQVATGLDPLTGRAAEWGTTKSLIGAIIGTVFTIGATVLILNWLAWDAEIERRRKAREEGR